VEVEVTEVSGEEEEGTEGIAPAPATGKSNWGRGDRFFKKRFMLCEGWTSWASTRERTKERKTKKGTSSFREENMASRGV